MGGNSKSQFFLVFLICTLISENESQTIKGFDRFNYKPRRHQLNNLSPQSMQIQMSHYRHPWGAKIERSSNFELHFEIGRKIVLICAATGDPLPNITWMKDGVELYAHKWVIISEWVYGDHRHIKSSKMEIHPASAMDRGDYECLAENKYSVDRRRFKAEYID